MAKQSNLMILSYRSQIGDRRPLKIHRLGTQDARGIGKFGRYQNNRLIE